ncbi:hypothetical protein JHK84_042751 [Glycine max]|nr:hypothetical protein JHK84_042751 [Glycine max]
MILCLFGFCTRSKTETDSSSNMHFLTLDMDKFLSNMEREKPISQEWFPVWVWKRFDAGELVELRMACGIEERHHKMAERMVKVALLCVQYRPDSRPIMSDVVKMLEGSVEISKPMNPFQHMMDGTIPGHSAQASQTDANTSVNSGSSATVTQPGIVYDNPMMRNDDIEWTSTIADE